MHQVKNTPNDDVMWGPNEFKVTLNAQITPEWEQYVIL